MMNSNVVMEMTGGDEIQFRKLHEEMSLGERMKMYEKAMERRIEEGNVFIVRLDGHSFSKFTKSMHQPWDSKFTAAMAMTAADLLKEFQPTTAYVQSDEISLTFFPIKSKNNDREWEPYIFNGRIQKIVSVMAGFASARFNHHLQQLISNPNQPEYRDPSIHILPTSSRSLNHYPLYDVLSCKDNGYEMHSAGRAHFDGRIAEFESEHELYNCILWRTRDCFKNVVSKTAEKLVGNKSCYKKNTQEKLAMIEEKDPGHMATINPGVVDGIFVKKSLYHNEEGSIRSKSSFYAGPFSTKSETRREWDDFIKSKNTADCKLLRHINEL